MNTPLLSVFLFFSAIYASDCNAYNKSSWVEKSWTYEAISYYPFEGNEKILDIGCGDGEITSLLSQKTLHGKVYGIDVASSMIDYANQMWTQKNLRFELQDIEVIECEEKFDLITAFFTFHWIKNKKQMLENCMRLLSPKGHIWMVTPSKIPTELETAAHFVCQNPKWSSFFTNFQLPTSYLSQKETHELLCKQGLCPIYMKARQKEMIFGSRQDLHKALRSSFPYLQCLSEDLHDAFLTDLLDQYLILRPLDQYHRPSCVLEAVEVIGVKNWKRCLYTNYWKNRELGKKLTPPKTDSSSSLYMHSLSFAELPPERRKILRSGEVRKVPFLHFQNSSINQVLKKRDCAELPVQLAIEKFRENIRKTFHFLDFF